MPISRICASNQLPTARDGSSSPAPDASRLAFPALPHPQGRLVSSSAADVPAGHLCVSAALGGAVACTRGAQPEKVLAAAGRGRASPPRMPGEPMFFLVYVPEDLYGIALPSPIDVLCCREVAFTGQEARRVRWSRQGHPGTDHHSFLRLQAARTSRSRPPIGPSAADTGGKSRRSVRQSKSMAAGATR
jgi:hypothetical protein